MSHIAGRLHGGEASLAAAGIGGAGRAARTIRCANGRRTHDRLVHARFCWTASLTRDTPRLSRRASAPQQGHALPGRSADRRGDRLRDAPRTRGPARLAAARDDRDALARWASRSGGARAQRARSRPTPRIGARAPRQGWTSPGGRHGRLGLGEPQAVALGAPRTPRRPAVLRGDGPTRGRPWSAAAVRSEFRRHAAEAGVRRRFAPHQLRHAHAVELAREGVSLNVIQRQLGHANLGTTSIYLQGIDIEEIISTVHARRAPMMSATAGLQL